MPKLAATQAQQWEHKKGFDDDDSLLKILIFSLLFFTVYSRCKLCVSASSIDSLYRLFLNSNNVIYLGSFITSSIPGSKEKREKYKYVPKSNEACPINFEFIVMHHEHSCTELRKIKPRRMQAHKYCGMAKKTLLRFA